MQIVIDIPEEEYKDVKKTGGCYYDFGKAIYYGTPLPKGHGRLIDADELLKEKRCFEDFDGDIFNIIHEETVINAPTIIEADNAESEDKE